MLSSLAGLLIVVFTGTISNYLTFIIGIFIGSLVFSAMGLIIAFKTNSMNQFILSIIPTMMFIIVPGVAYIIALKSAWFLFHPGIAITELIINGDNIFLAICSLLIWLLVIYFIALKIVNKRFKHESGVN